MASTTYKDIVENNFNLAPSQLLDLGSRNKNTLFVRDLLDRKLNFSDNGNEVGSINYISKSTHYFIRAKALQKESFLPFITKETTIPIRPQVFYDFNLQKGDLLISKDSNIGEAVVLDKDYPNYSISGALYKLPITKGKYYLLAFLKHSYFKKQLDLLVPKGATIRHAKTLFLNCKIPFPKQKNSKTIIRYVEALTKAIVNKEKAIQSKNQSIFESIQKELLENQKKKEFKYALPKIDELKTSTRIDSGYYSFEYKEKQFLIKNYANGAFPIKKWGYQINRGQNLQVSQIGKSIYSDTKKDNFYTLIRPTNFSDFGTVKKFEYLGNQKKLSALETGDIVFSAEGTIGKCILFVDPKERWITNIHGIILNKKDHNVEESAFVSCFLRFLRVWEVLNYISVGGQGGSLAKECWKDILIPKFTRKKRQEIASLYCNPIDYYTSLNLDNFLERDDRWNKKAGIIELDNSAKKIKNHLDKVLDKIVDNAEIKIDLYLT